MPYLIQVDLDRQFIWVVVEGEVTASLIFEFSREASAIAKRHGFYRYLFDLRKGVGKVPSADIVELADNPEARGISRGDRRAMLVSYDVAGHALFQQVSDSRGYTVNNFSDFDKAINWLVDE
jgi:hypothetical protein